MGGNRIPAERLGVALEPEVRSHFPGSGRARVRNLARTERGFATETYLFEVEDDFGTVPLVLRRPPDLSLFPDYDLLRQVLVMRQLARTPIPVPTVTWLERGDNPLGSPYFVMNRLEGAAPSDYPSYHAAGNYFEASPEQRARMWWGCVDTIAEINQLDWRALELDFLAFPQYGAGVVEQGVNYLDAALNWACEGAPPETYRRAAGYLREHLYEPEEISLCWGDARMSNILYDTDFRVHGVLDWEISHLGAPESDLAWMLFLDWACSEYEGHPPLAGTPSREETIAHYEKRTGYQVRNLEYQEVFSAALLSIPLLRMTHRVQLPPEMNITGFCTARIEQLLG
ncbi:phosphotransferase family protein [Nocardia seriolae]|uniref:Acyl-CoA dehydrogenase n=1 Tax=Nocardia seriolae TaxID=37332 RepID=A0ABC9Z2X1_9NOCA|nr:phosphotransferase family protein [Nocardia seriolae]OJF83707.1 acyl-CoA dehydrogenase [Nocardia seriolae]WKY52348.1 phosphotransferase family protein [Nocardia seriolae]WNJ59609.1 phosphotransferase family protein [Nocardia seriolae]BAW03600.1 acyl-CoA dehydrogenase [Nocardia seriolae]BEK84479.1 phosphotransferase family protein [Nocardia seriolae]